MVCGGRRVARSTASSGTSVSTSPAPGEEMVEPAVRPDVVVLEVEETDARVLERRAVPRDVSVDEALLDGPVHVAIRRHRVPGEPGQDVGPAREQRQGARVGSGQARVGLTCLQVDQLDLEGREGAAVPETHAPAERRIPGDRAQRADWRLEAHVCPEAPVLDHVEDQRRRANLQVGRHLGHAGVADDHVQATEALAVGVGLVARVDHRPAGHRRARHLLRDVLGSLAQVVLEPRRPPIDVPRPRQDLTADEEGNERFHQARERRVPGHEIVLVTAVGIPGRVGVVLEHLDPARDLVLREPAVGAPHEILDDAFPRPVVGHEVEEIVALRRRVLRMEARVHVEAGAILQEDVRVARARDELVEEVPGEHLGRQDGLTVPRADGPVLALEAEDPAPHHLRR